MTTRFMKTRSVVDRWLEFGPAEPKIGRCLSFNLNLARGVSAILVLLYHVKLNVLAPSSNPGPGDRIVDALCECGPQAVFWFFVISGYLVGGKALVTLQRRDFDIWRYGSERAARIYAVLVPAIVVGLAFDGIRIAAFGLNASAGAETPLSYSPLTLIGNLFCLQTIFVPVAGSNNPLWSLALEAWYYVIFGAVVWTIGSAGARKSGGVLGVVALVCALGIFRYNLVTLFPIWLFGVAARCVAFKSAKSGSLCWAFAIAVMLSYPYWHRFGTLAADYAVGLSFATVLIAARSATATPSGALERVARSLADFSFSLYVLHAPLIHFFLAFCRGSGYVRLDYTGMNLEVGLAFLLLVSISIMAAYAFSLVTERNTHKVLTFIRSSLRIAPAAGASSAPTGASEAG